MNDEMKVQKMKDIVENIIREKTQLNYGTNDGISKREIVKEIMKELDKVMEDED